MNFNLSFNSDSSQSLPPSSSSESERNRALAGLSLAPSESQSNTNLHQLAEAAHADQPARIANSSLALTNVPTQFNHVNRERTSNWSYDALESSSSEEIESSEDEYQGHVEQMHEAIRNNDSDEVRRLNEIVDIDDRDESGYTPLMTATSLRNPRMVQTLLSLGADPNLILSEDDQSSSALSMAVAARDLRTTRILLNNDANLYSSEHGNLLHSALDAPNKGMIKLLISHLLTELENVDEENYNSLYSLLTERDSTHRRTPAQRLADKNHFEPIKKLLALNGGRNQGGEQLLHESLDKLVLTDSSRKTVRNNAEKLIETLLETDIDFTTRSRRGETPLRRAIRAELDWIAYSLLDYLTPQQINRTDGDGHNALHQSLLTGNREMFETLVEMDGINLNTRTPYGYSPLHLAVNQRNISAVDKLLAAAVNTHTATSRNDTPLHSAVQLRQNSIIERLMDSDPPLDKFNFHGLSPLHLAATLDNPDALERILQGVSDKQREELSRDAQIDFEGFDQEERYTPLQLAVVHDLPLNIEVLLRFGADHKTTEGGAEGKNLLDLALREKSNGAFRFLMQQDLQFPLRNDDENAHDSIINEDLRRYLVQIKESLQSTAPLSLENVTTNFKEYLEGLGESGEEAASIFDQILEEDDIEIAHITPDGSEEVETEKGVLCWVYTFISHQEETLRETLLHSLTHRLQDCIDPDSMDDDLLCPPGRTNRYLDTLTGLIPGYEIVSTDLIKHEMLYKASHIYKNRLASEDQATQDAFKTQHPSPEQKELTGAFEEKLKTELRSIFHEDYIVPNIISESRLSAIVNEWIDRI